jgi:hypothetical protein
VEVPDAVGAVIGRGQPVGTPLSGPARARGGSDAEQAELIEGEDPVREAVQDVLDAVELGVAVGVRRFLPRLGALEGDAVAGEQAA